MFGLLSVSLGVVLASYAMAREVAILHTPCRAHCNCGPWSCNACSLGNWGIGTTGLLLQKPLAANKSTGEQVTPSLKMKRYQCTLERSLKTAGGRPKNNVNSTPTAENVENKSEKVHESVDRRWGTATFFIQAFQQVAVIADWRMSGSM